jgi:hypothetical protein
MGLLDGILGGNGGGFNLGSLVDPLGLAKSDSPLSKIIDPLGILGGLEGALGGIGNNPTAKADSSGLSSVMQQILGQHNSNQVNPFSDPSASASNQLMIPSPAATEYQPHPQYPNSGFATNSVLANSSQAATGTPASGLSSSSQAATGVPANGQQASDWLNSDEGKALTEIAGNFPMFENRGAAQSFDPGFFDPQSLANEAANDAGTPLGDAAKYLLTHPDLLAKLQMLSGGNGQVSKSGLTQYIASMMGASTQGAPTQGTSTPPANNPINNVTVCGTINPTTPTITQGTPSSSTAANSTTSSSVPSSPPLCSSQPRSIDECVGTFDNAINGLEGQIESLSAAAANGDKNAQTQLTQLQFQMQRLMDLRKQMFDLASNLEHMFDEMSMQAINNTR